MTMGWIAVGSAVAGAATSIYGANKSAKAQKEANAMNAKLAADQNAQNYQLWLESQGIGPDGRPVNTRLPRYMRIQTGNPKRRLIKKGSAGPQPMRAYAAGTSNAPAGVAAYGAGGGVAGPADIASFANTGQYMQ